MYTDIGYCTYTESRLVATSFIRLQGLVGNNLEITAKVTDLFTRAQFDVKRGQFYDFMPAEMMRLAAAAAQDPAGYALYRIIHIVLSHCGRCVPIYPVLYYREDPSMTFAEVMWKVALLKLDFSKVSDFMGQPTKAFTILNLSEALVDFFNHLDIWFGCIDLNVTRLEAYLGSLKYKLLMNQGLDQFEKTVYMHAMHTVYGTKVTMGQSRINPIIEQLEPRECADPLVAMFVDDFKKVCLPGPKFTYIPMISNTRPEAMFAYCGPYANKAVVTAGSIVVNGPYSLLQLKPMISPLEMTIDQHLIGLMTTSDLALKELDPEFLGIQTGEGTMRNVRWAFDQPQVNRTNEYDTTEIVEFIPIIPDIPEVILVWYRNTVHLRYISEVLNRTVTTNAFDGALYEIARKHKQYGGTYNFKSSIDEFTTCDISAIKDRILDLKAIEVPVVFQDIEQGPRKKSVDMGPYFCLFGSKLVKPAFAEYFKAPQSMLQTPQTSAVDYISQSLGLTELETLMSKDALTICYNGFILRQIFGRVPQIGAEVLPTDDVLIKFAKTTLFDKGI